MTTIALTPEGEAFLARVRDELADLPPDERDELLEDIESHLAEVAGEGEVALAARLGSAEEFAQELRNSAGLPPRAAPSSPSRLDVARAWLDGVVRRVASLRPHLDAALVWRLARGWLLAVAFAVTIATLGNTAAWSYRHTWLPHAGLRGSGALIALAGFVALSFWLARRAAAGRGVQLDRAASALALVAIVPALWHLDNPARDVVCVGCTYQTVAPAPPGLYFNGVRVRNVFPFDRDGKPLEDVLLYLSSGQPLDINARTTDLNRRYLVSRAGRRLYNSFPVRFYNPGTRQVATGWIRPSVHIPVVLTPPTGSHAP
jgi:hypothetical protein